MSVFYDTRKHPLRGIAILIRVEALFEFHIFIVRFPAVSSLYLGYQSILSLYYRTRQLIERQLESAHLVGIMLKIVHVENDRTHKIRIVEEYARIVSDQNIGRYVKVIDISV